MKLVTFAVSSPLGPHERIGVISGDKVVDVAAVYETLLAQRGVYSARQLAESVIPPCMREFLSRWPVSKETTEECIDFLKRRDTTTCSPSGAQLTYNRSDVRLKIPIRPPRIKDYLTYEEHKRKGFAKLGLPMPEEWYRAPTYTNRNVLGLADPDQDIAWPNYTKKFDFEFEIAAVIGRVGRNITVEDAPSYIAGFTIYNDFSARDTQADEKASGSGPGKSKDFDQGNVLGPCIVTSDEISSADIALTLRVSGEEWSRGNTREMQFSWAQIIANASREETIYPGDVFASGTMNNGCCLELDRWFEDGAVIEMEAAGIGILRNRVVRASK